MWVIYLFILQVIFNVVLKSIQEDLGEDPGCWTHVDSTLTR